MKRVLLAAAVALGAVAGCSKAGDEQSQLKPPPALPSGAPHAESAGEEPLPVKFRSNEKKLPGAPAPTMIPVPPKPDL